MRQGKVFFHPIDGSAPLSISWSSKPKGDAVEAKNGLGIGFFSERGDLLSVIFDDVKEHGDCQTLEFSHHQIEVTTHHGKVHFKVQISTRVQKPVKRSIRKPVVRPHKRTPAHTRS